MSTGPAAAEPSVPGRELAWAKWVVLALLGYWTAFAAVAPVMNWDSQTYNLARLYIANQGGLFGNRGWNYLHQAVFPWTFDAVHYPFLFLHWGYCLPSFACLCGLLIIVYRLVAAAWSAREAWCCCLALLALPTLVFQAVCTKNDLAVVFGVGCWFYAWTLWRAERRNVYLLLMAVALGFTAGAKTNGLPFFGVLGVYTLWGLRSSPWQAARFAGWMVVSLLLLGSVEIYLNNALVFHAPLGPPGFIDMNRNRDGIAGGLANFIRYFIGNMNVGIDVANPVSPVPAWLGNECRDFLRLTGLLRNIGLRANSGDTDATIVFIKNGYDSATDFGPVGAIALIAGVGLALARPWSDPLWKLAAAGLATLALPAYTVAWMPWNARFLMLPFGLLTVALTLWTLRLGSVPGPGRAVRSAFLVMVVFSAVVYPLYSYGKKPTDLWLALRHRPVYETHERASMLGVIQDLRARARADGPFVLLLHAGDNSWTFCVMELRGLQVVSAPTLDRKTLVAAERQSHAGGAHLPVYVLALDQPTVAHIAPGLLPEFTLVKTYAEPCTALFRWQPPAPASSAR